MTLKIEKQRVDIILPNFNSHEYLESTLKSIISQNYKYWRLLIVDDSSNRKTKKILKKYLKNKKIKIIFLKKNKGAGYCRNLALGLCKSKYVAFIDSDDLWNKNKLSQQIKFMNKNNYDFTYTNYLTFKSRNEKKILNKIVPPSKFNYENFIKNTSIGTSTMIIKTKIAKQYKFTKTKICEDYYYKCMILRKVKYAYRLNMPLTKYRIRNNSLQSNKIRNLYWIWKINKKFNKLNVIRNFYSIIWISINSVIKYRFK